MKPYPSIRRSGRGTHCCKRVSFGGLNISASRSVSVRAGSMRIIRLPVMRSDPLVWAWVPRGDVPADEASHEPSDQVSVAFQREVPCVEQGELQSLLQVPLVSSEHRAIRLRPSERLITRPPPLSLWPRSTP